MTHMTKSQRRWLHVHLTCWGMVPIIFLFMFGNATGSVLLAILLIGILSLVAFGFAVHIRNSRRARIKAQSDAVLVRTNWARLHGGVEL